VTTVDLHFQDAGTEAGHLLEVLLRACDGAKRGGAVFAWTNASGVRAFLEDKSFARFIQQGEFDLVVGLDSITDEAAVKALIARTTQWPKLSVRAFLHEQSVFFHPKLAWFLSDKELTLIVGSGNLTMGGLTNNWEAFTVVRLTDTAAAAISQQIQDWLAAQSHTLVPITDNRVIERARRNVGNERSLKRVPRTAAPKEAATQQGVEMLVAEIPGGTNLRWGQANFDRQNYEDFFGARVGTQKRIFLYHVAEDGGLGDLESRPSVEVKSQNYRFELSAARGVDYPSDGRPIGVFLRLATDEFLYMLLLPDSPHYPAVSGFIESHWTGRADRMRRVRTNVEELRAAWPNAPLWQASLPEL